MSQQDFDQLLQQVRDLTVRVHRLESLVHLQAPQAATAPTVPARPAVNQAPPSLQAPPSTPPPPIFVTPAVVRESSDLEARIGSHWLNRIGIAAVPLVRTPQRNTVDRDDSCCGAPGQLGCARSEGKRIIRHTITRSPNHCPAESV